MKSADALEVKTNPECGQMVPNIFPGASFRLGKEPSAAVGADKADNGTGRFDTVLTGHNGCVRLKVRCNGLSVPNIADMENVGSRPDSTQNIVYLNAVCVFAMLMMMILVSVTIL